MLRNYIEGKLETKIYLTHVDRQSCVTSTQNRYLNVSESDDGRNMRVLSSTTEV